MLDVKKMSPVWSLVIQYQHSYVGLILEDHRNPVSYYLTHFRKNKSEIPGLAFSHFLLSSCFSMNSNLYKKPSVTPEICVQSFESIILVSTFPDTQL